MEQCDHKKIYWTLDDPAWQAEMRSPIGKIRTLRNAPFCNEVILCQTFIPATFFPRYGTVQHLRPFSLFLVSMFRVNPDHKCLLRKLAYSTVFVRVAFLSRACVCLWWRVIANKTISNYKKNAISRMQTFRVSLNVDGVFFDVWLFYRKRFSFANRIRLKL